jgi:hypothetical protein
MIQPLEIQGARPIQLHNGMASTTAAVWAVLLASRAGDLNKLKELTAGCPELLTCQYDYTSPLHFAVGEGHRNVVRYLVETAGIDPDCRNHPFLDSLATLADDRGFTEIAAFLRASMADPRRVREWEDVGTIDHGRDEEQKRFQTMIDKNRHAEVEAMLAVRPELAKDGLAFWGEGILCMPAKDGDHRMIDVLMSYGARVPAVSKWGARYYFKHCDTAEYLLRKGMNPNHKNWREFTLLHDFAFTGDARKVELLLDHGADIDAVDEEYHSTPLGYAARWGRDEVARLLLARGADPHKAGRPWATPREWACKKGHTAIEAILKTA